MAQPTDTEAPGRLAEISFDPPAPNELEVSIFGPGFGECVVAHLGFGQWMVVDSCVGRGATAPAAIEYLNKLSVNIEQSIAIIVATHWHDDHVRGISSLFESAKRAKLFAAKALRSDEFLALANRPDLTSRFSSGVEELAKARRIVDERRRQEGEAIGLVGAVQRLWHSDDAPVTAVWSLSPSDEDSSRSIEHIASLLPRQSVGVARIPSLDPNDASVVLLLETRVGAVLLGGDLEHIRSSRTRGWHAVLDHSGRPTDMASFFKIPHHGSENADCPEVWEHMVEPDAICVLSPFERGKTPLPRPSDLTRIRQRTANGYITSTKRGAPSRRERATQKMIEEATRSFRPEGLSMGHVQARSTGEKWAVRVSSSAAII